MNANEIDYESLNRELKRFRDSIAKKGMEEIKKGTGDFVWHLKRTATLSIYHALQRLSNSLKANEWILLQLQILSLPDDIIDPKKLAILIPKALSKITSILKIQRISLKPDTFLFYLFLYKKLITNDRLLYIYLNHTPEKFGIFVAKLKRKIILTLYETFFFKFAEKDKNQLELWCTYWIQLGIINKDKELQMLQRLQIRSNIAEICKEPEIKLKYFTKKNEVENVKPDKINNSEYNENKADLLDSYLNPSVIGIV